jgi:hypothetical protein
MTCEAAYDDKVTVECCKTEFCNRNMTPTYAPLPKEGRLGLRSSVPPR